MLELSGAIASVLANLEHRRDEDFYFHERLRLLGGHRLRSHEGARERAHKPAGEMLRQRKSGHALLFQRRDNRCWRPIFQAASGATSARLVKRVRFRGALAEVMVRPHWQIIGLQPPITRC